MDPNTVNIQVADQLLVPSILTVPGTASDIYSDAQSKIRNNIDDIRTQLVNFFYQLEKGHEYKIIGYTYSPFTVPWSTLITLNYRISGDTLFKLYNLGSFQKSIMTTLANYAQGYEEHLRQNEIYSTDGKCICQYATLKSFFYPPRSLG